MLSIRRSPMAGILQEPRMTQLQTGALARPKSGLLSPEVAAGTEYASEAPPSPEF